MKKKQLEEMISTSTQNCLNEQQKIEQLRAERSDPGRPEKVSNSIIFISSNFLS